MIPHNQLSLNKDEKDAVNKVLSSGWLTSADQVKYFENELCDFLNLPHGHALLVSSGSAALYLSLWSLRAQNKKIGIPVYSCCSLRNACHLINAKPVYLDSSLESPNIEIDSFANKKLDILIAPSIYGIPINLKKENSFKIIEDISQSFGSSIGQKKIGLRGEIGVCSFAATKLMTSGGQGGVIFSKKKQLIEELKDYRDFDNRDDKKIRFNFLMTNMQAAVGRVQLKKLPKFLQKRDKIFKVYKDKGLNLIDCQSKLVNPVRPRAILNTNEPKKMVAKLKENYISSIVPLRTGELLDDKKMYKNAKMFTESTVAIPIYPDLSISKAKMIADTILKIKL